MSLPEQVLPWARRARQIVRHPAATWLFRGVVLASLLGVLWYELFRRNDLDQMWAEFKTHLHGANWFLLLAVVGLMPLNWLTETEKWFRFVRPYDTQLTRRKATQAVLAGVSISLFTPNRVGEYGGRILWVQPAHHWRAILTNLVCNLGQFLVLLGAGVPGAAYVLYRFDLLPNPYAPLLVAGGFLGLAVGLWGYFHFRGVLSLVRRLPFENHFEWLLQWLQLDALLQFRRRELLEILRWSGLRYLIYSAQYFLLLRFFGIQADFLGGLAGIAGLFLLQTTIPLPPMTGLVARGNLAVYLWQQFGANDLSALAATFSLWVINLILPALIGTFLLLRVNIAQSLNYNNEESTPPNVLETAPAPLAVAHPDE
jgi:uncharacterized membrane protein YbhN (UPF0104 family)